MARDLPSNPAAEFELAVATPPKNQALPVSKSPQDISNLCPRKRLDNQVLPERTHCDHRRRPHLRRATSALPLRSLPQIFERVVTAQVVESSKSPYPV